MRHASKMKSVGDKPRLRNEAASSGKGILAARTLLAASLVVAFVIAIMAIGSPVAQAASFSDDGYINQLMTGDSGKSAGWDENVIENVDPSLKGTNSTLLTHDISGFFNGLALMIISFSVIFAVARLAGRGICEIVASSGKTGVPSKSKAKSSVSTSIPPFFLTGAERGKKGPQSNWVRPMLVETGICIGVGLFVGSIISILSGVAIMIVGEASDATSPKTSIGSVIGGLLGSK